MPLKGEAKAAWQRKYRQTKKGREVMQNANRNYDRATRARLDAKRRTRKEQASPSWSDTEWQMFAISETYKCARLRSDLTGVPHEVDHIVPLQGKTVSGLHVAENLQVLTRTENRQKAASHGGR